MRLINSIFLRILVCGIMMLTGLDTSHATHIVGGEMNYRCLGNDQYEIIMTVFRDCENGIPNFDDPASIGFFDENDNLISSVAFQGVLQIDYIMDDTLDPTLFDSCLVVPPDVCVDQTTYIDTLILPFRLGGYNVVYQRCCRNMTILNIVGPEDTGATYGINITEEAMLECNSNAVFKEWPPNYICVNEPILFDHSALDAEGDSLVYKLCVPFDGADRESCIPPNTQVPCFDPLQPCGPRPCPPFNPPFDNVVWIPPYSLNNMMGGIPLAIDPVTGLLTGTPNTIGQFVVGICVEEYRDGELISLTKRDFQYNVGQCGEAISAFFAPAVDCDGFTVNFDNQSQDAVDFTWDFGDSTTTSDISFETNPSYTYPDTGLYVIEMIAGPNEACADTSYSTVSVQIPSLFVDFELAGLIDGCVYPAQVSFADLSYDTISTIVDWDWQFSNGDSSDEENPVWYVTDSGTYFATLTVTAANGCQVSHTDFLSIDVLELGLQDTASICEGISTSVILNPGTDPSYTYNWSPIESLDNGTSPSPLATPSSNTTYYVTIEDNLGCVYVDSVYVAVPTAITVQASDDELICETALEIFATSNTAISYEWYDDSALNNLVGIGEIIEVSPGESSIYYVVATDSYGCTSSDEVQVGSQAVVVDVPAQVTICKENGFEIEAINLNPDDVLSYEWLPEDFIVNGANSSNPTVLLEEDGILTLIVENQYGCFDTLLIPVDVIENQLDIMATADPDSIFLGENSQLNVIPQGDYIYQWTMGNLLDNDMVENPIATPLATTTFNVFVEDEFGCKDTSSVTIILKTYLCEEPYIFVPNAFTPDNDGMNDIFYVRGNAIDELLMVVYNRWGEKIFETRNLNTGWDGTHKGKKLTPDVYGYYLELSCLNGEKYFKKGNVTLIR